MSRQTSTSDCRRVEQAESSPHLVGFLFSIVNFWQSWQFLQSPPISFISVINGNGKVFVSPTRAITRDSGDFPVPRSPFLLPVLPPDIENK
jgi:hypothetical protein